MQKPIFAPESFQDIQFPAYGLDVSQGFDSQRPNTTNVGTNVRLYEPSTFRARGGARPGLLKYIPAQMPNGPHLIQMLDTIVSVPGTPSAIVPPGFNLPPPQTLDVPFTGPGAVPDPSDPGPSSWWSPFQPSRIPTGRTVPPGGSGIIRYKNPPKSKKMFSFIQANDNYDPTGSPYYLHTTPFLLSCTSGNLLILAASYNENPFGAPTPTDTLGSTYLFITSIETSLAPNPWIGMWYAIAPSTGSNSVTAIATSGNALQGAVIAEYSGNSNTPLDLFGSNESAVSPWSGTPNPFPFTTGSVSVSQTGELALAFSLGIQTAASGCSFASDPSFAVRRITNDAGTYSHGYPNIVLQDQLSVSAPVQANGSQTSTPAQIGGSLSILSIIVSFFHG